MNQSNEAREGCHSGMSGKSHPESGLYALMLLMSATLGQQSDSAVSDTTLTKEKAAKAGRVNTRFEKQVRRLNMKADKKRKIFQ